MSQSAASDEATIPLGYVDLEQAAMTIVYLLKLSDTPAVDPQRIKAAAEGVARKWRLYAGRIHLDKKSHAYSIRAPLGDIPPHYKLVNFTSLTINQPFPTPSPPTSATTCAFLPPLNLATLRAPSTTGDVLSLAKKDIAIASIHVVTYTDYQQISFTIGHAIVDNTAFAVYLRAFSDELNGVPWDPPALESTTSKLEEAVERILADTSPEQYKDLSIGRGGPLEGGYGKHWSQVPLLLGAVAYEKMWHGVEDGGAFLGREVVEWLVKRVKEEVKEQTGGKEWVSTGDVLWAWLLKSAYEDEPHHGTPRISTGMCLRAVLGLEGRAQHTMSTYWSLHGPSPHFASLAELALHNRRRLHASRTPLKTAAVQAWCKREQSPVPLWVSLGFNSWRISDQRQTGVSQAVDWGCGRGKSQNLWIKDKTDTLDNVMLLVEREEGYVWSGVMRRTRWASVRRAMSELGSEFGKRK